MSMTEGVGAIDTALYAESLVAAAVFWVQRAIRKKASW